MQFKACLRFKIIFSIGKSISCAFVPKIIKCMLTLRRKSGRKSEREKKKSRKLTGTGLGCQCFSVHKPYCLVGKKTVLEF